MQIILNTENITQQFSTNILFKNINIEIIKGELLGIIGGNGTGKTTLFKILSGIIEPTKGKVWLRKEDVSGPHLISIKKELQKKIGFAAQIPSFYQELTVQQNLSYFAKMYNLPKRAINRNIITAMLLVGLSEEKDKVACNLSGGKQKALDIACALVHNPSILILDEPTADLDQTIKKQILEVIRKINQNGKTIIISSHHMDEIRSLCTRVLLIEQKEIKEFSFFKNITLELENKDYTGIILELSRNNIKNQVQENQLIIKTQNLELELYYLSNIIFKRKEKIISLDIN
ncbi:MAG: ABC transporter ATP-binding protein [Candidatus Woesearchaeota archaeon]